MSDVDQRFAEIVENLLEQPAWQIADVQLKHEPLWRRILKFLRR